MPMDATINPVSGDEPVAPLPGSGGGPARQPAARKRPAPPAPPPGAPARPEAPGPRPAPDSPRGRHIDDHA
ncbi:hypothetical protein [Thiomonas sp.]|uniref:hypothetical protein n=1 Tax=Thiomonas sp. TaxID=2047785 RepID=UPI00263451EF|nr:hypothetical protein [Thiomonas sp.]